MNRNSSKAALDNRNLQSVVDDLAKRGMRDSEIRQQLWGSDAFGKAIPRSQAIPTPSVTAQRIRSNLLSQQIDWKNDSESELFSRGYRATGQTLLDRIIHGFGPLLKEISGKAHLSNFELIRDTCRGISKTHGNTCESSPHDPAYADMACFATVAASLSPWLIGPKPTTNIQISSELAEAFLAAKGAKSPASLPSSPFYIDINETASGQRTLSGIFCWPTNGTIAYMAAIEWINCGYEAFILGDVETPARSIVTMPVDKGDCPIPQDQVDLLYGEIPHQINKLISMGLSYYESQLANRIPFHVFPVAHKTHPGSATVDEKRARNKEKTHSYFRVLRIETPQDVIESRSSNARRSWSLDHIITVNGHLRWQPYGPGNTYRKLIWIDAYDKGEGQRHRPENNPELVASRRMTLH